ncbi:TniQ family protein [Cryobacterium luteum]|uniref:TniQ domain-containing protein n=1 Tax=Cryobacterium luteum TaxID=1424661 RepID=A0A1H8L8G0_9MICO|nr:TniQ family protein [Cryobacterium luteum]TFB94446.1 hypothetical protein E3O10_01340 [Cryobacterium luteum]SEO01452.1 TniQ protein [Cryobacterium luteum]
MTEPRRWPLHPAPIDGETFYSWLRRIAACYGTDLTLLGEDLGFTLRWSAPEDIDAAAMSGMIDVLAERTGVTPDRLRQMGMAGWVPWRRDKSAEVQQSEQRPCRFPGCVRAAMSADSGTGRPPEYCDNDGHNRAAGWRARHRLADELSGNAPDEKRPVDAARQRADDLYGQVAGMAPHLVQQLTVFIDELRIVADPDAAEVQIESVMAEADAHIAAATARTSRAEHAGSQANAERVEADAAARKASELAEEQQAELAVSQHELGNRTHALDQVTAELVVVRSAAKAHNAQAQAELSLLREQLVTVRTRVGEAEHDRDDATARAEAASTARAAAEERARGAVARAVDNAARAQRVEANVAKIRGERGHVRIVHDTIREEVNTLRGNLATAIAERDAAWENTRRERTHLDQRVSDLRTTQVQQLTQLRDEAADLRQDVREQRDRADRAHPTAQTDAAAMKPAR